MAEQNRSTAVMQRRGAMSPDELDFFPTPAWGTRALVEHVLPLVGWQKSDCAFARVWEPACGEGHMAKPLAEYFGATYASDVHDYGFGEVHEFLFPTQAPFIADWIITNPPFRLGEQFVAKALGLSYAGCAMLVRGAFAEGAGRYRTLFKHTPPAVIATFAERLSMVKGRVDIDANSATSYCWMVWKHRWTGYPRAAWIPPCRAALERPGDYPAAAPTDTPLLDMLSASATKENTDAAAG